MNEAYNTIRRWRQRSMQRIPTCMCLGAFNLIPQNVNDSLSIVAICECVFVYVCSLLGALMWQSVKMLMQMDGFQNSVRRSHLLKCKCAVGNLLFAMNIAVSERFATPMHLETDSFFIHCLSLLRRLAIWIGIRVIDVVYWRMESNSKQMRTNNILTILLHLQFYPIFPWIQ